jgi:hypothetical protein
LSIHVNPRARTREDRAGDPLDGLVNLFDLGIVLAVAFLLAALTSIDLAPSVLKQNSEQQTQGSQVPADSVIVEPGEEDNPIELQQGERVAGQGEPVGTVYRLDDGRTVIVRPQDEPPVPGEEPSDDAPNSSSPSSPGTGSSTAPDTTLPSDTPTTPTTPRDGDSPVDNEALTTPQPTTGSP